MKKVLPQWIKAATGHIEHEIRYEDLSQWRINHCYHVGTRLFNLGDRRGYLLFHAFLDPVNLRWTLTGNTPVLYTNKREALRKATEWRDED